MIIEEGQSEIKLPERIDLHYSSFGVYSDGDPEKNPHSILYHVHAVNLEEIKTMDRELRGIPRMYTIMDGMTTCKLVFWPTSDKKTIGRLEYMPAPKVL